ncbi:MAG: hypothetical protein SH818_17475 [Saprospiraceae bacterium]|nr:hypothetical protein [Saprospiraceae bacterium]
MLRKSLFALITFQFLAAFLHSLSFLGKPAATNETEKQLIDLFTNYKQDLGAGFSRSTYDLFTGLSACFPLICVLGGWINLYFLRKKLDSSLFRGLLFIEMVVFGVLFAVMITFTFLPPIVVTGLIFSGCGMAWFYSSRDSLT